MWVSGYPATMKGEDINQMIEIEDQHWWYAERRYLLESLLRRYQISGSALDIGAGGGGNTQVLIDNNLKASALEFTKEGVAKCQSKGIQVLQGDAREIPFADSSFDFAMAWDVIEHIEEDYKVLTEVKRVLKPGGIFSVSVPCDMALWSKHDVELGHVRRYEKEGLSKLISDTGFEILDLWSWNVLMKPLVKFRRKSNKVDHHAINPLINIALRMVVSLERLRIFRNLPGVSLMVICRKRNGTS